MTGKLRGMTDEESFYRQILASHVDLAGDGSGDEGRAAFLEILREYGRKILR